MSAGTLVLVPAAAVAAPLLDAVLGRFVRVPLVVFEIVLGMLLGPAVLGWVIPDEFLSTLASLGLAMLFFLAGWEIDFASIRGRALNRSLIGWLGALTIGVTAGALIEHGLASGVFVGVALSSTALGTLMPVLRDAGEDRTPWGRAVIAIGAVGEFGPLIAISLFLSGRRTGVAAAVLLAFVVITALVIVASARLSHRRLHSLITRTLHTSGQFAVRFVILVIGALVALGVALDLDMPLGAFAAGLVVRLVLGSAAPKVREVVESKMEAMGFGFFVPVFFIFTGLTYDLGALTSSPWMPVLLVGFAVLLLLVRGLSGLLTAPRGATAADRRAIVLLTATGLPIIITVTDVGVRSGDVTRGTASALVGAGMLSVLLFPLIGLAQRPRAAGANPEGEGEGAVDSREDEVNDE